MEDTKVFEFYWGDLTPECQKRLYDFLGGRMVTMMLFRLQHWRFRKILMRSR